MRPTSSPMFFRLVRRILQGYLASAAVCTIAFCWTTYSAHHAIAFRIPGIQSGISTCRGQWSQTVYLRWWGWDVDFRHNSTTTVMDRPFSRLHMNEGFYFSHVSTSPQKVRFAFPLWALVMFLSAWPMMTFVLYLYDKRKQRFGRRRNPSTNMTSNTLENETPLRSAHASV